ncbi:hypothetical protein Sste5346_000935 [Sporothrix stenoceras]|uniref:Uncharacterized protein n=1 Tax=Sporothrix stenoceras TaxID=5173 RepID=A0ABR3ZRX9_9PEZI
MHQSLSSSAIDSPDNASIVTNSDSSSSGGYGYPYNCGQRALGKAGHSVLKPAMVDVWLDTLGRNELQTYEVLYVNYQEPTMLNIWVSTFNRDKLHIYEILFAKFQVPAFRS